MQTKEQSPLPVTFEEGLTDIDLEELNEDLNSSFSEAIKRDNPANSDNAVASETRTTKSVPDVDKTNPYLPETPSNTANPIVRARSKGIVYQISYIKQAKIEIYDVSAYPRKLVSTTLVDLSLAKSHSVFGRYNNKHHEINFTVKGRWLTIHEINLSDGLEFILTEE